MALIANNKSILITYRYGKNMHDLETLLVTDDILEASKITKWLDLWDYNVKTTRFSNNHFFNDDLLNNDLILVDITIDDVNIGKKVLEIIKQNIKVSYYIFYLL